MGEEVNDDIDGEAYVGIELNINDTVVNIKRKRLILKSEKDRLSYINNNVTEKNNESAKRDDKIVNRSRSRSIHSRDKDKKKPKKLKWVIPGIVVRMISKKVDNGKLYNKKLRITDVLNPYQFLAVPDTSDEQNGQSNGSLVVYENLREKDLETVLPKETEC
jgi:hypothetical protein